MDKILMPGDQIAYVPMHARGDVDHDDTEFGFVRSVGRSVVWCRFWRKGEPGALRTRANSESCLPESLVLHKSVDQRVVDRIMERLDEEEVS